MPPKLIFIFIDGIGLGAAGDLNPFATHCLPGFELLSDGQSWTEGAKPIRSDNHCFFGIDAQLGVEGLPQSGTGQASLFTGINCASLAGRHFGPYPHSTSKAAIAESNIFTRLGQLGQPVAFANAYPPVFFEHAKKRNRWSVTTRMCLDSKTEIRTLGHLENNTAVAADITGRGLAVGLNLPVLAINETTAAENLLKLASFNSLTLFEYFHTDKAGHKQSQKDAASCLLSLSRFLTRLVELSLESETTILLTSDHGNLEDLSVKTHTLNPVPFIALGPCAISFSRVTSLTHVTPVVESLFV